MADTPVQDESTAIEPHPTPVENAPFEAVEAKTELLVESVDLSKARIDADQRVIHNVRLISAGKSLNGRRYDSAVLEKAAPLFENVKSYSDHPTRSDSKERPERSMREITGWFTDVQFRKDGVYASRHFTRNQAGQDSWALAEDVISGRAPKNLLELSINAVGKGRVESVDGEPVLNVESINRVFSVDDVTTGAAGGSFVPLLASDSESLALSIVKEMSFQEWLDAQPDYANRLRKQWQKVRLEDETKSALAEADQQVKTANAETERIQQTVEQLQEAVRRLTTERDTAFDTAKRKTCELAIERALGKSGLPASYKQDLRERLPKIPETEWAATIEKEQTKARRSGAINRPLVSGSASQEAKPAPSVAIAESLDPLPNEDVKQWMARLERLQQMRTT